MGANCAFWLFLQRFAADFCGALQHRVVPARASASHCVVKFSYSHKRLTNKETLWSVLFFEIFFEPTVLCLDILLEGKNFPCQFEGTFAVSCVVSEEKEVDYFTPDSSKALI